MRQVVDELIEDTVEKAIAKIGAAPALAVIGDQTLFGLFLPGPDLMLAASLHSTHERGERQFLFEHLDRLSAGDLLLLDRGYPCRWLVAVLNHRSINFCMRVDNSDTGFTCVRQLLRSGERERIVMLRAPDRQDARDDECPRQPQRVRLIRHITPNGEHRVLMTKLFDEQRFPALGFGELYHQRWGRRPSNASNTASTWSMSADCPSRP